MFLTQTEHTNHLVISFSDELNVKSLPFLSFKGHARHAVLMTSKSMKYPQLLNKLVAPLESRAYELQGCGSNAVWLFPHKNGFFSPSWAWINEKYEEVCTSLGFRAIYPSLAISEQFQCHSQRYFQFTAGNLWIGCFSCHFVGKWEKNKQNKTTSFRLRAGGRKSL